MTPRRRELMLIVSSGNESALPLLFHLDSYVRCDEMLAWLIKNKLVGDEFVQWTRFHFGQSMMNMASHILSRLEKSKKPRPVLWGRDFVQ